MRHDTADVGHEAEVEHAVGFVQHEELALVDDQVAGAHKVADAPWGANNNVRAAGHAVNLAGAADAADDEDGVQRQAGAEFLELLLNLHREFAGR